MSTPASKLAGLGGLHPFRIMLAWIICMFVPQCTNSRKIYYCMHRASYCSMYINRPTRCTNSYNVSLFIIKCSTCFGLFSPSSGIDISRYVWLLPRNSQTYGTRLYQLRYTAPKRRSWWWTKESETFSALNDK